MGNVFLHGKGGAGGAGLNFKVVGGTTAPSNPKDNMIWINTDVKISSWVFSATQPTAESGKVWISTGTSSTVEFNALKKNGIQVYPLFAKQYVNGAWVDKPAKSYQNGKWVDWINYIYNKGETSYSFATKAAKNLSSGSTEGKKPTVTLNADNVNIEINQTYHSGNSGMAYISEKINLTDYSTLVCDGEFFADYSVGHNALCVWSAIGTYTSDNVVASVNLVSAPNTVEDKILTIDVSKLSGSYYIGVRISSSSASIAKTYAKIRQLYLK